MASWRNDDRFSIQESFRDDKDEKSSIVFSNGWTFILDGKRKKVISTTERWFDNTQPCIGTVVLYSRSTQGHGQADQIPVVFVRYTIKNPSFKSIRKRVLSFENWPVKIKQTPYQLAEAGFFFTGFDDCVCCFVCDGKLHRWCINDDPWTEHCRLFPLCPFVREQKGDEFIDRIMDAALALQNDESVAMEEQLIVRAHMEEMRGAFLEMGYEESVLRKAFLHVQNLGISQPTIDDVAELITDVTDEREYSSERQTYETSLQGNRSLRQMVFCMLCGTNNVDTLFLPCKHNRTCNGCAGRLTVCPACQTYIEKKIPTSMTKL